MKCKLTKLTASQIEDEICVKLLNHEMRMSSLPQKFRIANYSLFYSAFRADRHAPKQQYQEDLELLKHDITTVAVAKENLTSVYVAMSENQTGT